MELLFAKEDLYKHIQMIESICGSKKTLPILSNIRIKATDDIEFAATDLELGISTIVPGTIVTKGSIAIPAKKFSSIVRELPNQEIKIKMTSNDRVEITCGQGTYKLKSLPSEDFPALAPRLKSDFVIDSELLCSMIYKTEFSASTEVTRHFLNGVFFDLISEYPKIVATDGRRLAIAINDTLISCLLYTSPSPRD